MIITLITVGTLKEDYLKDAACEYKKRLSQYAKVEEINLKEELIKDEDNSAEISKALENEAKRIIAAIPKDSYKIALCVEGREYSSPELADIVRRANDSRGKLTLVIGSSHGLSENVKSECDLRLSFSKLTFPHQLMRVLLAEAVYRALNIVKGTKYHK